jgi:TPR repeat protein
MLGRRQQNRSRMKGTRQHSLRMGYLQCGFGVDLDEVQACEYSKQSGDGGNSDGQAAYGYCFEHGVDVLVDLREVALYYRWSADQGDAYGQMNFGLCLEFGKGISIDLVEAVRYYKLSADQGDSDGQFGTANYRGPRCHRRPGRRP